MQPVRGTRYLTQTMKAQVSDTSDWTHFPHDADIAVRGFGASPAEAFENAARAMSAAVTPLESIRTVETVTVRCRCPDVEILLIDWLNAVIYEMATRKMLFGEFNVKITGEQLEAELRGEPVDVARHAPAVEPKGATLTALKVAQEASGRWIAQCVVDV